jgi:NADPH-dependent curcumin reductase CurA
LPAVLSDLRNQRFVLATRPTTRPDGSTFRLETAALEEPSDGEVAVKNLLVSLDPAMRMWMNAGRSYIEPVALGSPMRAIGLGEVLASRDGRFSPGDLVTGVLGVQRYATLNGDQLTPADGNLQPLKLHLSLFGLTGMSAYFGLLDVGQPRAGETVVVSAAAGAVGSVVGQIAKLKGCRVIGIAGGAEKCAYLVDELGFDAAVDYKDGHLDEQLAVATPDRIDVFFDNVGGTVLEAALDRLAHGARVVLSGAISQYNSEAPTGPANYLNLAVDRARMQGFIVTDYGPRFAEAAADLARWRQAGQLKTDEELIPGLDSFPAALERLFTGQSRGKLILDLTEAA